MSTTNLELELRKSIPESATALKISRALLYRRIAEGKIRAHKDGDRTFITVEELRRYVDSQAATA